MSDPSILIPDFDDTLEELGSDISAGLNCIQIAKIESVNLAAQTVNANIQVRRRLPGGVIKAYPIILDCPFIVLQGSGSFVDVPIAAGDYCLLLFNDRDIDNWWSAENVTAPNTRRKHSLSDGFALVGVNPKPSVLALDGSVLGLRGGGNKVRIDNTAETLLTLVEDLITAVNAIVTTNGGAVNPASQAALDLVKSRFALLLEA